MIVKQIKIGKPTKAIFFIFAYVFRQFVLYQAWKDNVPIFASFFAIDFWHILTWSPITAQLFVFCWVGSYSLLCVLRRSSWNFYQVLVSCNLICFKNNYGFVQETKNLHIILPSLLRHLNNGDMNITTFFKSVWASANFFSVASLNQNIPSHFLLSAFFQHHQKILLLVICKNSLCNMYLKSLICILFAQISWPGFIIVLKKNYIKIYFRNEKLFTDCY